MRNTGVRNSTSDGMNGDAVQGIVDALAEQLRRSVAVDDHSGSLVASSRHFGDEDEGRIRSVINRRMPDEAMRRIRTLGIHRAEGPVKFDGLEAHGIVPRIVWPVRDDEGLLGYLWLIGSAPEQDEGIRRAASLIAEILRERARRQYSVGRQLEGILEAAINGRPSEKRTYDEISPEFPHCRVFVSLNSAEGNQHSIGVVSAAHTLGAHAVSRLVEGGATVAVVVATDESVLRRLCRRLAEESALRSGDSSRRLILGTSSLGGGSTLRGACREAFLTAVAAEYLSEDSTVVEYQEVRFIEQLVAENPDATGSSCGPSLIVPELDEGSDTSMLRDTLRSYLRYAGDSAQAAAELSVHRTTLYYRLRRIREVFGIDLTTGPGRLRGSMAILRSDVLRSPLYAALTV